MSFSLTSRVRTRFAQPGWAGVAFIVEALVLLAFLGAGVAIFTRLFSLAAAQSDEALVLARAVAAAQSTAERFSADPKAIYTVEADGDLTVVSEITWEETATGTLYRAVISVYAADAKAAAKAPESEGVAPDGAPGVAPEEALAGEPADVVYGDSGDISDGEGAGEGSWPEDAGAAAYEGLEPLYRIETAVFERGGTR